MTFDWHRFVPASARSAAGLVDGAPPCLSGRLLVRHAGAIDAPVVEMTARRAAHIMGFLRACRQADAVAVIAVDADVREQRPGAGAQAVQGILTAAVAALYTGPLVLVARAWQPRGGVDDDSILTLVGEGVARDLAAGFGAIGLPAAVMTNAALLERALRSADELDIGIELEVGDADASLLLASVDDASLPVSAVRGAGPLDEVGTATRVTDLADLKGLDGVDPGGLRVNLDSLIAACTAVGNDGSTVADDGTAAVGDDELVEGKVWLAVGRALRALKASGSASRLAAALLEAP